MSAKFHRFVSVHARQPTLATLAALACLGAAARTATAAVSFTGNVTPTPPVGGGNVASPFLVGDSATGTLTINNGTLLSVTGGGAIFGDDDAAFASARSPAWERASRRATI